VKPTSGTDAWVPDLGADAKNLTAALAYAEAGYAAFPVNREKHPLTEHGHLDASTDPDTIRQWWGRHPGAWIGLVPKPGQAIIDVETEAGHGEGKDGRGEFSRRCEQLGSTEAHPVAVTDNDGLHVWGRLPEGVELTHEYHPHPGVEIRTHKGYVIVPPSNGRHWRTPLDGEPPLWPQAWVDYMTKPYYEPDEPPKTKPRNNSKLSTGALSKDRKRHIALKILDRAENKLAAERAARDTATGRAIKDLAKFHNEGWLSEAEIHDAVVRAAYANDLDKDVKNGGIEKIKGDVPRCLAANRGLSVDWDRFDWLYDDAEVRPKAKAENNGEASESDDEAEKTPVLADLLLTRSDLRTLPDPEPLIDNVLDQGTTPLLYGKWGTAKTFIALDWAASVATGHAWQGRKTEQRRVLYVVGEGAFGFKGRVEAWEVGWQTKISDERLSILPVPVNLMRPVEVDNLMALIDWGGYSLVVLDTLARCMVGADENSAKDCGIVADVMTRLLARTPGGRGVVLGVHHTGKDEKTLRGSSAFEGGADTVYFTARDEGLITLTREKRKDGPENDHHLLKLDPIAGTGSCVIGVSHGMSHEGETFDRTATLRLIMSQHFVSTGATAAQLRQLAVDDGPMTRPTYYRALSELLESGWLVNTGTEKRPFYVVVNE
jgi:AAA domain/Bifunctional DNA primase/polymerase, N-terminal